MADMNDNTEFVIVSQCYPIWAKLIRRDRDDVFEPVIAWRIAVDDPARRPVPICPMRGELSLDDIGDFFNTPEAAE
jgi:hypothetical protein